MHTVPSRLGVMDAIEQRTSVRSYTQDKLGRNTIQALLDAAVRAPTAVHQEAWSFVIVQDAALLRRLSDRAKGLFLEEVQRHRPARGEHLLETFKQPDFNIFYDAGTLIVICGPTDGLFVAADCWLAAANLMLAARGIGLGTCVIGSAVAGLNTPELKAELGIPPEVSAVAPIIVGRPREETQPTRRKSPHVLAWR